MNSFAMSVLPVLALRPKMDAEETSVVWLDRCTEQQTFRNQSARTHRVGVHFATEIHTVLAPPKEPPPPTRTYSGPHPTPRVALPVMLCVAHRAHPPDHAFAAVAHAPST